MRPASSLRNTEREILKKLKTKLKNTKKGFIYSTLSARKPPTIPE